MRQYNSALDTSFLVPTVGFVAGALSENFVNMELVGTSLGYSLTIGSGAQTERLHQFTADQALGDVYQVRRPTLWITSARTANGLSLYTRSDYRRDSWSTIMLSAGDVDAGAMAAVTGSIEPGYAPQIGISPGVLATGIETMATMLDDRSTEQEETAPAAADLPPAGSEGGSARNQA